MPRVFLEPASPCLTLQIFRPAELKKNVRAERDAGLLPAVALVASSGPLAWIA